MKLILITQNLSCPGCNSIINLKRDRKKKFLEKCLSLNFLLENIFFLCLILIFICGILVCTYSEFQKKYFHVKVILLIFQVLLEIIFVVEYFKFLKNIPKIPFQEKLTFKEKKFENENNSDSQVAIQLNPKLGNKPFLNNYITNKRVNSFIIFEMFLKVNFQISSIQILEYKNERNQKNKIDDDHKKSILNIFAIYNNKILKSNVGVEGLTNIHANINKEFNSYLNFLKVNDLNLESNHESKNESEREKMISSQRLLLRENVNNSNVTYGNKDKLGSNLLSMVNPSNINNSNVLQLQVIHTTTPKNSDRTLKNKNGSVLNVENIIPTNSAKYSNKNFVIEKKSEKEIETNIDYDKNMLLKSIDNVLHIEDNTQQFSKYPSKKSLAEQKSLVTSSNNISDQPIPAYKSQEYQITSQDSIVPYAQPDDECQINIHKQIVQMKYTNLSLKKIEEIDSILYYPDEEKSRLSMKYNNIPTNFINISCKNNIYDLHATQSPSKSFLKSQVNNKSIINNISNINNFIDENFTLQHEHNTGHTFVKGLSELIKDGNIINDEISQNSNKYLYKNTISQFSGKADSNIRGSFLTNSNNIFDFGTSSSEVDKDKFSTQILKNSDFLVNLDSPKRKNIRYVTYNYHKNQDYMNNFSLVNKNKIKKSRVNNSKGKTKKNSSKFSKSLIHNSDKNEYDIDNFYKKISEKDKNGEVHHGMI